MNKLVKITEIATLLKSPQFPNYQRYRFQILISQTEDLIKDLIKFHVLIFYTLRDINRQRASRSGRVGPIHRFKRFS